MEDRETSHLFFKVVLHPRIISFLKTKKQEDIHIHTITLHSMLNAAEFYSSDCRTVFIFAQSKIFQKSDGKLGVLESSREIDF